MTAAASLLIFVSLYLAGLFWWYRWQRKRDRARDRRRWSLLTESDELRLLVKEGERALYRTVEGRCLVGWTRDGVVTSGVLAANPDDRAYLVAWAVIQSKSGKLVVYRFNKREGEAAATGEVQILDSFAQLEAVVPPRIFERALREAGILKPEDYETLPLEGV
jgi:hypothetical protein